MLFRSWSEPYTWAYFQPLVAGIHPDLGLQIIPVDYSTTAGFGIQINANIARMQLMPYLRAFKKSSNVAAVQFDVVGHSMGGLIARALPTLPMVPDLSYGRGFIHKLFTLDTPHTGSELANTLLESSPRCQALFNFAGLPVGDNIKDLRVGSQLLATLQVPRQGISAHVFGSTASVFQKLTTELELLVLKALVKKAPGGISDVIEDAVCLNLLPRGLSPLGGGFDKLFHGPNDLIVSLNSQLGVGVSFPGDFLPPSDTFANTVHTVIPFLLPIGPDVLQRDVLFVITVGPSAGFAPLSATKVLQFLNQPVYGPAFGLIRP